MGVLSLILLVLLVWLQWYIANEFFTAAKAKGYHDRKYRWICFWLSVIGYLLVIALPDRGESGCAASDELPEL